MSGKKEKAHNFRPVFFQYFTDRKEVTQGLGHLLAVYIDETVVHPVPHKLHAARRL